MNWSLKNLCKCWISHDFGHRIGTSHSPARAKKRSEQLEVKSRSAPKEGWAAHKLCRAREKISSLPICKLSASPEKSFLSLFHISMPEHHVPCPGVKAECVHGDLQGEFSFMAVKREDLNYQVWFFSPQIFNVLFCSRNYTVNNDLFAALWLGAERNR